MPSDRGVLEVEFDRCLPGLIKSVFDRLPCLVNFVEDSSLIGSNLTAFFEGVTLLGVVVRGDDDTVGDAKCVEDCFRVKTDSGFEFTDDCEEVEDLDETKADADSVDEDCGEVTDDTAFDSTASTDNDRWS